MKVLTQERPQPILELHVAGRLRPGVLGHHFAERLAVRPGISAGPVVIVVPVPEHLQLLSVCPVSDAIVVV